MARDLTVAAIVLLLGACSTTEVIRIDLAAAPDVSSADYLFLVTTRDGRPVRASAPIVRGAGGGAGLGLRLTASEDGGIVVGLRAADLERAVPGFVAARSTELRLTLGTPPPAPRFREHGRVELADLALPPEAALLRAAPPSRLDPLDPAARDTFTRDVVLTAPADPERCGGDPPPHGALRPFGDRAVLLPSESRVPGIDPTERIHRDFERLVRADADRVLALARGAIYVVRRGRAIDSLSMFAPGRPSEIVPVAKLDGGNDPELSAKGIAVSPALRPDGARSVIVAGEERGGRGAAWDLLLRPGGLEVVGRISFDASVPELGDVAFDERGDALAIAPEGQVFLRRSGNPGFVTALSFAGRSGALRRVFATGDPSAPHAFTFNTGKVAVGDAAGGTSRLETIDAAAIALHPVAVAAFPARGELWVGGTKGALFRRLGADRWVAVRPFLPPRIQACAALSTATDEFVIGRDVLAMAAAKDHVFLVLNGCTAVLAVRASDHCATVIPREGEPPGVTDQEMVAASIGGGALAVGGDDGSLFDGDGRPPR